MVRDVPTMFKWVVCRNIPRTELQRRSAAFVKVFIPPFSLSLSREPKSRMINTESLSAEECWNVKVLNLGKVDPKEKEFYDCQNIW